MLFSLKNLPGYLSKTAISHDFTFKTFTKKEKREGLSAFDLSCFLEPAPKPAAASTPAQEVCLVSSQAATTGLQKATWIGSCQLERSDQQTRASPCQNEWPKYL